MAVLLLTAATATNGISAAPPDSVKVYAKHTVKWGYLHLLNFYPTAQFAYEYRWQPRYGLQADVGVVVPGANANDRYRNKRGVKLKTEFRYYAHVSGNQQHFASIEPYLNTINFDRQASVIECFDAACTRQFSRTFLYRINYRESGFSMKYGLVNWSGRFSIEMHLGWTLRAVHYRKPTLPANAIAEPPFYFAIINEEKRISVSPLISCRVGFALSRLAPAD
jgi:hypothetical protein